MRKNERLVKNRLNIRERIGDPSRMTLKRAKSTILERFPFDPEIQAVFMNRPDLTKKQGISFCKKTKNLGNWLLLFDHPNLYFSFLEILHWAIVADEKYNHYGDIFQKHPDKERKNFFPDLSILTKVLERDSFTNFVKTAPSIELLILKIRLGNDIVDEAIEKERKNIWEDSSNVIPIRLFSLIVALIAYLPLRILFSSVAHSYLQMYLNKRRP